MKKFCFSIVYVTLSNEKLLNMFTDGRTTVLVRFTILWLLVDLKTQTSQQSCW